MYREMVPGPVPGGGPPVRLIPGAGVGTVRAATAFGRQMRLATPDVPTLLPVLAMVPVPVWHCALPDLPATLPADILLERVRREGHVAWANPAAARRACACTPAELVGRPVPFTLLPRDPSVTEAFRRFVAGGFALEDHELRDDEGRAYRVSWRGEVVHGALRGLWAAMEETTAQRELARRLAEAPEAVEEALVGTSPALQEVLARIRQVAPTDATVLIRGETGTGKELVARAIHAASPRRQRPLVAVNCGAIAAGVIESELFGHEKGAFTGATARRPGRFELADGGTLFLDEIGDLSLDLQVKLLRVLQEGEFTRVGGSEAVRVDVRIVAATHRDLARMVREGSFREDLYYRLNVFPIRTPALRERLGDLPLLVDHLVARHARRLGRRIEQVPEAVRATLAAYPWPGNVRELSNVLERSVIVSAGPVLQLAEWNTGQYQPVAAAAPAPGPAVPLGAVPAATLLEVEREHILRELERARWKVSGPGGAAEALGLKPTTLESRMKRLGIERPR